MDVSVLKDWLGLIALLISIGTSVVLFVGSGAKKNSARIEELDADLTAHDRRIQKIESDLGHLPDRETIHKLELAIADLSGGLRAMEAQIEGQLKAMDERLKPISQTTIRLQEFLIAQAEK